MQTKSLIILTALLLISCTRVEPEQITKPVNKPITESMSKLTEHIAHTCNFDEIGYEPTTGQEYITCEDSESLLEVMMEIGRYLGQWDTEMAENVKVEMISYGGDDEGEGSKYEIWVGDAQ